MDRWQYLLVSIRQVCLSRKVWHELELSWVVLSIQLEKGREENKLLTSA